MFGPRSRVFEDGVAAVGSTLEASQDVHAMAAAFAPEAEAKELQLHVKTGGNGNPGPEGQPCLQSLICDMARAYDWCDAQLL